MARECRLPGLAAWGRVRDWRLLQIEKIPNVSLYLESEMTPEAVAELGADHVLIATGSTWRRDGTGRHHVKPIAIDAGADILTPDDLMAGRRPNGRDVVIFDDDHYYMGGVLAELLRKEDYGVTLVTPSSLVSSFTRASLEQTAIQTRLLQLGVKIEANASVAAISSGEVTLACVFTGKARRMSCTSAVLVTARNPVDALYHELVTAGLTTSRAGDCFGPGTIAAAVHSGRKFAEEFGDPPRDMLDIPFRREVTALT